MPSRNIVKAFAPQSFYHAYARGSSKMTIFRDASDYSYFIRLFVRYLSGVETKAKSGELYPNFYGRLELVAFCLMRNHTHLLIWQKDAETMSQFMRCLMTSYSMYFNRKYKRSGQVLESCYKAKLVERDDHFVHISRYIHLNPRYWKCYRYSSLPYYAGASSASWVCPARVLELFSGRADYYAFLEDYETQKEYLNESKSYLSI